MPWPATEITVSRIDHFTRWTTTSRSACKRLRLCTFCQITTIITSKKHCNHLTITRTSASTYNRIISKYKLPTSISYRDTISASSSSSNNIHSTFNINTMRQGRTTWWIWIYLQTFLLMPVSQSTHFTVTSISEISVLWRSPLPDSQRQCTQSDKRHYWLNAKYLR